MKDAQTRLFDWEQAVLKADLPAPSKLILLVLRTFCRPGKPHCWPSIATLQRATSLSRRTIQRHLRALTASRWLIHTSKNVPWAPPNAPKPDTTTPPPTPTYTLRFPRDQRQSDTPPASERRPKRRKEERRKPIRIFHANHKTEEAQPRQPEHIGALIAEASETYNQSHTPGATSTLLDALETLDSANPQAREFWQRRLYDLRRANKLQQAIEIIDYALACSDPAQRRAKDLGEMANPAAWINAKTRDMLQF